MVSIYKPYKQREQAYLLLALFIAASISCFLLSMPSSCTDEAASSASISNIGECKHVETRYVWLSTKGMPI